LNHQVISEIVKLLNGSNHVNFLLFELLKLYNQT